MLTLSRARSAAWLVCAVALMASTSAAARTIVDALGRSVEVPERINRIVCTGPGALRLVTYLNRDHLLVGIESTDKKFSKNVLRDYAYARSDYFKHVPIIGRGGSTANTADAQAIVALLPDVILSGCSPKAIEELRQQTGLPVVSVHYSGENFFEGDFLKALFIAADLLHALPRAQELGDFIHAAQHDLMRRTQKIDRSARPSVYPAGISHIGTHGFTATYSNFGPLKVVGAHNVADRDDLQGFYEANADEIRRWNPDVIFLDPYSLPLVSQQYKGRKSFFQSLKAVKNGNLYLLPSFTQYNTNITYGLMNAYQVGKLLSPGAFSDIDLAAKMNEILTKFLGYAYYDKLAAFYGKTKLE